MYILKIVQLRPSLQTVNSYKFLHALLNFETNKYYFITILTVRTSDLLSVDFTIEILVSKWDGFRRKL